MDILKFAIVSDLHFCRSESDNDHSWLAYNQNGKIKASIWNDLQDLIHRDKLKVNALICPGDISTRACQKSLEIAWEHLNTLKKKLNAHALVASTGNHDVQSREKKAKTENPMMALEFYTDLNEGVKLLDPPFPIVSGESKNKAHQRRVNYFGTDFSIYDEDSAYRVVTLNSCARHTTSPREHERGSISQAALQWLEEELKNLKVKNVPKINILVCHHHPIKHSEHNSGEFDEMLSGEKLIKLLSKHGRWLIVHGHKHHARLKYANGGLKKTPVFAAGTLAAHKDGSLGSGLVNQFYILSIKKVDKYKDLKISVEAWTWDKVHAWRKSYSRSHGMYTGVGVGATTPIEELAEKINKIVPKDIRKPITWIDVQREIDDLNYYSPEDIENLEEELNSLGIHLEANDSNEIINVSRELQHD